MNIMSKGKLFITLMMFYVAAKGFAQPRMVLVEQFTNSGCPSCAGNTPVVAAYVNANPANSIMLAHHTAFPYLDSMYYENAMQSNQRVAYYSIGAVPNSRVDGNAFSGNLVPVLNSVIPARSMVLPRYQVNFTIANLTNNNVTATVAFSSTDAANMNENLVAHIVVVEKKVLKSSYVCCAGANSETEYPWVVRHMLPDGDGTILANKFLGGIDNVSVSWNANNIKDFNELRIVAFVQNNTTGEVYQAAITNPSVISGLNDHFADKATIFSINNPVINGEFKLMLNQAVRNKTLQLIDALGNSIYRETLSLDKGIYIFQKELRAGIYFIGLDSDNSKIYQKVIVN
jgi:hypothetical protein